MSTTKTQNASARKRILSVTVRRMIDDSPDSSYLGEYGSSPKSDYAIDRAHSEDCASVNFVSLQWLNRIENRLNDMRHDADDRGDVQDFDAIDEAMVNLEESRDCDCSFSGHWDAREYRYFNPNHENYKGLPEEEIRKYCRQDFDRMESLNNGQWCYIGIRAEAELSLPVQCNLGCVKGHEVYYQITQTLTSGGLYGIESDSGREHIQETIQEELSTLKTELLQLGFSKRAIATAFKPENICEKDEQEKTC